jgi:hypothetical protein
VIVQCYKKAFGGSSSTKTVNPIASGTDVMTLFNIFAEKLSKKWRFLLKMLRKSDRNIGFQDERQFFFSENVEKSLKIVIITLTPVFSCKD